MGLLAGIKVGWTRLFRKEQLDGHLNEELTDFFESSVEQKMRHGMSRDEAQKAARIEIGSAETVKHKVRSIGWEAGIEAICADLRYSLRMLAKSPGFTIVAVLSLALGIGANTAIFTLINQIMLKSLPVRDPQYLLNFGNAKSGGELDGFMAPGPLEIFTYEFYQQIEKNNPQLFEGVSAFNSAFNMVSVKRGTDGNAQASQAEAHLVSGNFFQVLGVEALLGRTLLPSDAEAPGKNAVVVLSYHYWRQAMGEDPSIVGGSLRVNGTIYTVAGVMPKSFYGVKLTEQAPDMWFPLTMQKEVTLQQNSLLDPHGLYWLHMIGRRRPGVSAGTIQAWVTSQLQLFLTQREGSALTPEHKQDIQKAYIEMLPGGGGISNLRFAYRDRLFILMAVVVLVLLIACANLANFLLAKAIAREREISTRLALGSSRRRILGQILLEALMLSFSGAVLGLGLAYGASYLLIKFIATNATYTALTARPDLHVLLFALGVTVLTALLFGLAPAVRVSRMSVTPALKANTRTAASSGGESGRVLPKILVVSQVVLSIVLLSCAGAFLRTLRNLEQTDFGIDRHSVLLVSINEKFAGYKSEQVHALGERLLGRMRALPGVRNASLSGHPPVSGRRWSAPVMIPGYPTPPEEKMGTTIRSISDRYVETMGIPVLYGRSFQSSDTATSPHVAMVNETFVKYYFPKGDALGRRVTMAAPGIDSEWQIVGIVKDAKYHGARDEAERMIYLPIVQLTGDSSYSYYIELQTAGDAAALTGAVRSALRDIDRDLPILRIETVEMQVEQTMGQEKILSQLSVVFSLLALLLSCIGLYGVMTHNVLRRTNEIGIRLALGAQTQGVLWMVMRESLWLLVTGLGVGIPVTLFAIHVVRSLLFGVSAYDPATLVSAVMVIATVTMVAAFFPARRASKVEPMTALRYE